MQDPFRTIHYEASEDAASPEGAAVDAGEGVEPAAEAEAWTPPSKEEVELMQDRLEWLEAHGAQQPQAQDYTEEDEEGEELSIFDLDVNQLRGMMRDVAMEVRMQEQAMAEGEAQMKDVLHDIQLRDGEFLNPASAEQRAIAVARDIYPQFAQRYGETDKAAEAALAKAASIVREEELTIGKAYHERQVNQVQTLASARREPGANGQGAEGAAAVQGGAGRTMQKYFGGGSGA